MPAQRPVLLGIVTPSQSAPLKALNSQGETQSIKPLAKSESLFMPQVSLAVRKVEGMKLNGPGGQNCWQQANHADLYSDQPQA